MEETRQQNKSGIVQGVLVTLLVVASFAIGSLYTKVQYYEKGAGKTTAVAGDTTGTAPEQQEGPSKYKSFEEAMKALAKDANADGNKLITCMNSGEKKELVDANFSYGNTLGVQGTPAFYVNGRFIGGAFPFEAFKEVIDKELDGTATDDIAGYSQLLQDAAKQGSFNPKPQVVDVGNAPVRGKASAKVTIVEFSDFQCPYCARSFPTMEQVLREYDGKVKLAYKHYPLSFHPRAQKTAEASECAKDQGKFWEFHDQLFKAQSDWTKF